MEGKLLCITAHPDDETLYAGVLLSKLAKRGIETHLLCATRGEDGSVGDPPVCSVEELADVREAELRCAADTLGIWSVEIIGYRNPRYVRGSGDLTAFDADPAEFEDLIIDACIRLSPDVVITHGSDGEYGHPGHMLVHRAVLRAHQTMLSMQTLSEWATPALYTFSAAVGGEPNSAFNDSDPADIVIHVTPRLEAKVAALSCHRTQHMDFFRAFPEACTLRDFLLLHGHVESLHRVWVPDGFDQATFFAREAGNESIIL